MVAVVCRGSGFVVVVVVAVAFQKRIHGKHVQSTKGKVHLVGTICDYCYSNYSFIPQQSHKPSNLSCFTNQSHHRQNNHSQRPTAIESLPKRGAPFSTSGEDAEPFLSPVARGLRSPAKLSDLVPDRT